MDTCRDGRYGHLKQFLNILQYIRWSIIEYYSCATIFLIEVTQCLIYEDTSIKSKVQRKSICVSNKYLMAVFYKQALTSDYRRHRMLSFVYLYAILRITKATHK